MIQISIAKCSMQSPTLYIDKPDIFQSNKKRLYAPYENIKICIQNNYEESIYLPSHSVFTINSVDMDEEERHLNEQIDRQAMELKPEEMYCNDYDLYFSKPGDDYYISAQYCRTLNERDDDTAPIIFERDCQEILTVSSSTLIVSCPVEVDCFPFIDLPVSFICTNEDLFIISCPHTTILY